MTNGHAAQRDAMPSDALHAPVVLFAYKRPVHTRRALEALAGNPEFEHSALHIYCDAARSPADEGAVDQTRELVRAFVHPNKQLVEAQTNQGLARSVIAGVTALCERYGRVIVVEDDLLVAPTFLDYMNRALDRYAHDPGVMQVSGHMFPIGLPTTDSVFLPLTTSWGWATWQRAWRQFDAGASGVARLRQSLGARYRFDLDGSFPYYAMLTDQLAGTVDSWAIRWHLAVFLASGRVLFPSRSLVENVGFDGSGAHCKMRVASDVPTPVTGHISVETVSPSIDVLAFQQVKMHLRRERGLVRRLADWKQRLTAA